MKMSRILHNALQSVYVTHWQIVFLMSIIILSLNCCLVFTLAVLLVYT